MCDKATSQRSLIPIWCVPECMCNIFLSTKRRRCKRHRIQMDTLGIEPRASRMLSGCDTTTPCARLQKKHVPNIAPRCAQARTMERIDKYIIGRDPSLPDPPPDPHAQVLPVRPQLDIATFRKLHLGRGILPSFPDALSLTRTV